MADTTVEITNRPRSDSEVAYRYDNIIYIQIFPCSNLCVLNLKGKYLLEA